MKKPAARQPLMREAEPLPSGVVARSAAYVLEDQIGFLMRKAHQRATDIFNTVMADFDITPTQFAALAKLYDLGAVSQNQLGRLVAMDPATIFGVAGRLIRRGLIRQRVDERDARLVLLDLTDEGRRTVEGMRAIGTEVTARTLEPLTPEEARQLVALIARIG